MPLLTLFQNLKLPIKFIIVTGFLGIGLVSLGLNYYQTVQIEEHSLERNKQLGTLSSLIDAVTIDVLEARAYQKDYQLKQQALAIDNFDESMSLANDATVAVEYFLRNDEDKQLVDTIQGRLKNYQDEFHKIVDLGNASTEKKPILYARIDSLIKAMEPLMDRFFAIKQDYQALDKMVSDTEKNLKFNLFVASIMVMLFALMATFIILRNGVLKPVEIIQNAVRKISLGDTETRSRLDSTDELGTLATTLDNLLDERMRALMLKQRENDLMNDSIMQMIHKVFALSQRDLTIYLPVAEDITGAISDSINQLSESIRSVLENVRAVAEKVVDTSNQVKSQSNTVIQSAREEQEEIEQTLAELEKAVAAMQLISELAQLTNEASLQAIDTTKNAEQSVSQTIGSINKIRNTINDAEKKIKRLGERSQEIGGIVKLLNRFSARTHLLAMNASMQANSSGAAGKGLLGVVEEVQRLAESSSEAAAEIEQLVNNIQQETADTVKAMNAVISNVVEGTQLAGQAGERMQQTRATTESLVESIQRIADNAIAQTAVAEQLRFRAVSIDASAQSTYDKMTQQARLSEDLVWSAKELQAAIGVFKLKP
ncbi:MAG: methyl-accepting chemotaxis protein [Methylovulum sp.]|uniref:methyl-accepting chemotaxis protein n=1 Tax=Methylovulum sp. TaxID=1916980 RepID=UPI00262E1E6B|nr:methyl-accepting chemotaxis protein [Methylovulum sp.]MDD2722828.1 methyl-accepting chemotaxis protein [Methylovulum sp.]MDD5124410.1 methyl-accepting chemotaxis protein [Methylovulum sp.]